MEKRDLLKDQIEQLGKVLGKIISGFMGQKNKGNTAQGIEVANENLKTELDLDMKLFLSLSGPELTAYLQSKELIPAHIEQLADYIAEMAVLAMPADREKALQLFRKTLEMYAIVDATSNTYSLERIHKEEKIKEKLSSA